MSRHPVSDESLLKAIEIVTHHVGLRIEKHGRGAFASNHEALGVTTEEYFELVDAVKRNDEQNVAEELIDIAVCGIFGLASKIKIEPVTTSTESESVNVTVETADFTSEFTQVESAAEVARRMMVERAERAGLFISTKLD